MQTKTFIQYSDVEILRGNTPILKQVSFSIRKGDFIYVLGETGSGKSSLLMSLSTQIPISNGSILIDDIFAHQLDKSSIPFFKRKFGIVSHSFPLVHYLNVYDNLDLVLSATGWEKESDKNSQIDKVLQLLKIESLKTANIQDLNKKTYVQVLLARALLNNPPILLLDAPVEDLDVQAAQEILAFIHQFAQKSNTTVFFTTVNNKIPKLLAGDKILTCQNQTIVEEDA